MDDTEQKNVVMDKDSSLFKKKSKGKQIKFSFKEMSIKTLLLLGFGSVLFLMLIV